MRCSSAFRRSAPGVLLAAMAGLAGCATADLQPAGGPLSRPEAPQALPIPVDGVTRARLSDSWGQARDGGRGHQGIDIFAPRGTPVRSTTAGVVVDKALRGLGGRFVSILDAGGFRHYYAHLEDWGTQAIGDRVEAGEVIGFVGNSGNAAVSPTHLHYGIYAPDGQAIEPFPLLRGDPFVLHPPALAPAG
jgi:murein DD-endopeptidase MepM/ murein hydrolase activator NlpD